VAVEAVVVGAVLVAGVGLFPPPPEQAAVMAQLSAAKYRNMSEFLRMTPPQALREKVRDERQSRSASILFCWWRNQTSANQQHRARNPTIESLVAFPPFLCRR
jgi:hypothetical protein